ncbi:MAG: restriction endonuclease [Caudoviricetes sp.]|nr:MAG: restriction endonuclease [Caudoviricetes sp.]
MDPEMNKAVLMVFEFGQASITMLQRKLKIGYGRAAKIVDSLEEKGIVGPFEGSAPRKILITKEQYLKRVKIEDRPLSISKPPKIDFDKIIKEEQEWRREQCGLPPIEFELQRVDGMDGHTFEYWCADLLKKNGFSDVEVTQGSGDQGVDIIAVKDEIRYAIQCKCYSSDLGNTPIQEVHTGKSIYHCQVGAVMTNRHFTAGAKMAADATGTLLWDRDKLIEMLQK